LYFSVFQGLAGVHLGNENIIEQALPCPASAQDILINKAALSILLSTMVGKYARRPLNHAVRELSLRALARRIVLAVHIPAKDQIILRRPHTSV
jgi:hypothetical protein